VAAVAVVAVTPIMVGELALLGVQVVAAVVVVAL
jgi:hypothetical protein